MLETSGVRQSFWRNSNTTLVKVKLFLKSKDTPEQLNSNTTLVKVKYVL